MATQKRIVLSKPEDWDSWISFVRNQVESHNVWNLIDPTFPVRPIGLVKPLEPLFELSDSAETFDSKAFEFQIQCGILQCTWKQQRKDVSQSVYRVNT